MINNRDLPAWLRFLGINCYGWMLRRRRFGKAFRRYQHLLEVTQYWSPAQLEAYQIERLSELLKDAAENVPFYGRHFAACGFDPSQFSNLHDLERIDPVSKAQLRSAGKDCLHKDFKRFNPRLFYTSGTTGEKFAYYVPEALRFALKFATIWRQYAWAGVKLFDRRVTIGGRFLTSKPPYWVYNSAENQLLLSIHHLNEQTAKLYCEKIIDFRPIFLQGHPTGIDFLAQYMMKHDLFIPLKAVFTTGETLFSEQRERIEIVFGCKVFEEYGQGECVFAAQESDAHCGFHEVSELGLIEFEPQNQKGMQQVIGTSLWNRAMPFIRYRVEDLVETASDHHKDTGRLGLPIKIKRVIGRVDDCLFDSEGHMVLPVTVRMSVKPYLNDSENYQVVQVGQRDYLLRLTGCCQSRDVRPIERILLNLFGKNACVNVELNGSLRSTGGKHRNVVNEHRSSISWN